MNDMKRKRPSLETTKGRSKPMVIKVGATRKKNSL